MKRNRFLGVILGATLAIGASACERDEREAIEGGRQAEPGATTPGAGVDVTSGDGVLGDDVGRDEGLTGAPENDLQRVRGIEGTPSDSSGGTTTLPGSSPGTVPNDTTGTVPNDTTGTTPDDTTGTTPDDTTGTMPDDTTGTEGSTGAQGTEGSTGGAY